MQACEKNEIPSQINAKVNNVEIDLISLPSNEIDQNFDESCSENFKYSKPAQDSLLKSINSNKEKLMKLLTVNNSIFATAETEKMITHCSNQIEKDEKALKRAKQSSRRSKKYRDAQRAKWSHAVELHPDLNKVLKVKDNVGRPRVETQYPDLLQTIIDIAIFGSGADERRRTELIRTCKTLDDLHQELRKTGIDISRSATYLRLVPRRNNTTEGFKHVKTVPVKLMRAQNSRHRSHVDTEFFTAIIRDLESLASFLGPQEVFFISQDDKARIPLGITAATKQSAILMHMDYRVTLPDHDFVKAERHKLIPSVYTCINIKENDFANPGLTYVAVRSGKHDTSNAETHAIDIDNILKHDAFKSACKTHFGSIKPILIITSDGGPDENPRYEKVIKHSIEKFKKYDLDAVYVVTNK